MLIFITASANAVIRNVPSQYTTIQAAINASSNTDTVLVQPGTYFENIIFRGKRIVVTSIFYQNNNYQAIQTTIINGSTPQHPDSASCVRIHNLEDSTTVLQGFTLTGGTGTNWNDEHFAGIYREGGGLLTALCSPIIQYNIITDNHTSNLGGVISNGGGGVRIGDGYPRFYNNIVMNNSANYGGGVVLNYTGGEYKNNLICKNYGSFEYGAGTGMWINNVFTRPKTIVNNSIVFNTSIQSTPGVNGAGGSATVFRNNIIWGNQSPGGFQISASGLQVRYCDVQGSYPGGGNIGDDPMFDSTNYYLKSASPCVDNGDSSLIYEDPPDPNNPSIAKWPARGGLRGDIGAYGGPGSKVIANTVVNIIHQNINSPEGFTLQQNYPNPFNPTTVIKYSIDKAQFTVLSVFDILGNEVEVLINENQMPGTYSVEWNASNYPSGVYFYELKGLTNQNIFSDKRKMILIK